MAHKASTEAIIRLSVRVPEIPDHIFHVESQHDLAYNALIETRMKWVAAIAQYFATTKSMNQYHIRDWDIILNYDGKIENVGDQIVEAAYESAVRQYPARYQLPKELNSLAMSASEAVRRQEMFALGGMFYHILSGKQLFHELGDRAYISQVVSALLVEGKFPDDVWTLPMAEVILAHWCLEIGEEFKKFTMPKLEPPVFYTPFLGGMIF
ncbi:hypothetical protein M7I_2158 [Glarea lozoyensis 74030]|nr:hypothetical protein M7I_2158 [Glarea lozoyensis 74030]